VSTFLADGNVLIALTVADHVHHETAVAWFEGTDASLATCPITEGTLIRFLLREGHTADEAISVLEVFRTQPWHRFWPDSLPYERPQLGGVLGHRQVTDAYLVALAADHAERLVTFDRGLSALHGDAVHLLSPSP